ncbi:MAG: 2OG-Fe(II) oxygenase family protein [Candidatus Woesearchaeota archaeon]
MIQKQYQDPKSLQKQFSQAKPFAHIALARFFEEQTLLEVLQALSNEEFAHKDSDLFDFYQTNDLKYTQNSILKNFIETLYSKEFLSYIEELTGFSLGDTVDIAGTLYQDTNYLLCHDDQLEGRKIAFLIYLSDMEQGEGGELNLYDHKDGTPQKIQKKIIPKFNTFALFEVTPTSFHSVQEVVVDKQRVAIGGWYHER